MLTQIHLNTLSHLHTFTQINRLDQQRDTATREWVFSTEEACLHCNGRTQEQSWMMDCNLVFSVCLTFYFFICLSQTHTQNQQISLYGG